MARIRADRFAYFTLFGASADDERRAREFAAALPEPCTSELHEPGYGNDDLPLDEGDGWTVLVRGPWTDPNDGEELLRRLAERYGGQYDGWEEMPAA